ncbi:MAG: prepilin-type N-terminal cleavage/methylation domain-containing protein [Planctomycetota bacterium]
MRAASGRSGVPRSRPLGRPAVAPARAFTLVETLVVISVVAVLVAITLPALRGTRESARDTKSLSDLRSLSGALYDYASDYRDAFPYVIEPGLVPGADQRLPFDRRQYDGYYRALSRYWVSAIYDRDPGAWRVATSGLDDATAGDPTPFWLTQTAFSAPAAWSLEPIGFQSGNYDAQRWRLIRFPSDKTILMALHRGRVARGDGEGGEIVYPLSHADGSATQQHVRNGLPDAFAARIPRPDPFAGLWTVDGLLGRDR